MNMCPYVSTLTCTSISITYSFGGDFLHEKKLLEPVDNKDREPKLDESTISYGQHRWSRKGRKFLLTRIPYTNSLQKLLARCGLCRTINSCPAPGQLLRLGTIREQSQPPVSGPVLLRILKDFRAMTRKYTGLLARGSHMLLK